MNGKKKYLKILILLMIINLFGALKVKAYYNVDRNQNVSITTAEYKNLSLAIDKSTYGMCNRDATIKLTINNPNNYSINYTITISDSKLTYNVDGSSSSSYTIIKNGTNTHTITLSGITTNTSVSIIVTPTGPYSSSHSKSINLDLTCPVCTWETPSVNKLMKDQTFTYNVTCTDESGIETSSLDAEAFTISNSNMISITDVNATKVANGYKYGLTVKGGSTNGLATISIKAGTVSDNNSNTNASVTSSNITINNNVTINFDANGGTTTVTSKVVNYKEKYGTLPEPTKNGYSFIGWYTAKDNGELISDATIVENKSAHTLYAHWLDATPPSCVFGSFDNEPVSTGKTASIVLTCTDNEGVATNILTSSAFTLSNNTAISISNITSSSITNGIEYIITIVGGTLTGESTITLNGGSVKDISGNANVKVTSPSILNIADQEPPVITFNPDGNLTYAKSQLSIVTVTDASTITTMKFLWTQTAGTSASSGTSFTSGTSLIKNNLDGVWYLCIYAKDEYDNEANECSNAFYLDNTPPTITFESDHSSETLKSHTVNVNVSDMAPIASAKYLWSTTSSGNPKANGTTFELTNGEANITKATGSGEYYLCIYAEDIAGNYNTSCYQALNFDNDGPIITTNTICTRLGADVPINKYISATDISGVTSIQASKNPNDTYITNLSELSAGIQTIYFRATDSLGNVSTPKAVTINVYMDLAEDLNVVTSGDGLYSVANSRKAFKGNSPNNYITFNEETWRIIAIESDGRIKIKRNELMTARAYGGTQNSSLRFTNSTIYTYLQNDYWNSLSSTAQSIVDTNSNWGIGSYKGYIASTSNSISKVSVYLSDELGQKSKFNVGMFTFSDFFYASSDSTCKTTLYISQIASNCKNNNWLKNSSGGNILIMNSYTYAANSYYQALAQKSDSGLTPLAVASTAPYYPVVYLKSGLSFVGSGTETDPYQLSTSCLQSTLSCTITLNETNNGSSNEQSDYTLSFTTSTTDPDVTVSSFNWSTGDTTDTATISNAGIYQLSLIDSSGRKSSCSISIASEKQYRTRRCNYTWSNWWQDSFSCYSSYPTTQVSQSKTWAEANNRSFYYVCGNSHEQCSGIGNEDSCYKYRRSCTKNQASCENYSWSSWGTTSATESCGTDVQTRTVLSE